jgi:3-oxoacyl-(acyl-carrier-protein) synthase
MTSQEVGAASAFAAFGTVMAIAEQCIPPTLNDRDPDSVCDLWSVTGAAAMPIRHGLSNTCAYPVASGSAYM